MTVKRELKDGGSQRIRSLSREGFTLIEVAFSIAVLAVGAMALFALISAGLEMNARTAADTQMAVFAGSVFNGLAAESVRAAEQSLVVRHGEDAGEDIGKVKERHDGWKEFWQEFKDGKKGVTVAAPEAFKWRDYEGSHGPGHWVSKYLKVKSGGIHTNIFYSYSFQKEQPTEIVNAALRYQLDVDFQGPDGPPDRTTELPVDPKEPAWGYQARVALRVWEGKFGSTHNPRTFYREFVNPGDL
jgi:prepilin-type N-terminal cleavage/methylation domain-containing protein